ncbi:electron transfer flavoprotein subunit alpha/FixB family protein [Alteromonas gilva]|uniref:FAD-binding protein n=1 Tax=Alteromonas gilva TaxID=2987522 RepID=A0ABT5KZE5_9ALTE|nr:FAD-binding protein [Alteromonas gilva]MDC8830144.1 FAD-binding protein [Alteromonas gilva]
MAILLIAEHDNQDLKPATLNTVSAAIELDLPITLLVIGSDCQAVAEQAGKVSGVSDVIVADDTAYAHQLAENTARLVAELASDYDYIMAPGTTTGKNVMPRVAALLDVAQISDIVAIVSADTFTRPTYAGNAMATVQSLDSKKVLTVRTSAFDAAGMTDNSAPVQTCGIVHTSQSEFVDEQLARSERPELASASVIISGGRGMGNGENFALLESVADKLGAAVGASRAAVDSGFVPNDMQVGQTGKIVAPDLYIAVGISGAIQHLAGMKDSKVIVAINKDEEAPIFQVADYGLVGDLFSVLPELENAL